MVTRNGRHAGEPKKRKRDKSSKEEEIPFIEISNGILICRHCGPGSPLHFYADEGGAEALGQELDLRDFKTWLYSSSVDFPTEYGAPDLPFRSIIEQASGLESTEEKPW